MPFSFWQAMCLPEILKLTDVTWQSAINSASSNARCTDFTTESRSLTPPFSMPRERCELNPTILKSPSGNTSPMITATFDVPISSATIKSLSLALLIVRLFS